MTTGEYLVTKSTLASGTALELFTNLVPPTITLIDTIEVTTTESIYTSDIVITEYTGDVVPVTLTADVTYDTMSADVIIDDIIVEG